MGGGGQNDAQNQEYSREDDSGAASDAVDDDAEEEHAEDLSDQVGIGQAGLYGAGDAIRVPMYFFESPCQVQFTVGREILRFAARHLNLQVGEQRFHVTNDLGVVSIAEQRHS